MPRLLPEDGSSKFLRIADGCYSVWFRILTERRSTELLFYVQISSHSFYVHRPEFCHGLGGFSPVSHLGGLGSIIAQSTCDLWCSKW